MLKTFRIIGYIEAMSLLVLLGVAMPLKYAWGMPMAVKIVGWIHGLLFVAYVAMLSTVSTDQGWPFRKTMWGLVAAVLPFGPFVFEASLRRD